MDHLQCVHCFHTLYISCIIWLGLLFYPWSSQQSCITWRYQYCHLYVTKTNATVCLTWPPFTKCHSSVSGVPASIQELLGSNLIPEPTHPNWCFFLRFLQSIQTNVGIVIHIKLCLLVSTYFSNSLFTNSTIQHYLIWATDGVSKLLINTNCSTSVIVFLISGVIYCPSFTVYSHLT